MDIDDYLKDPSFAAFYEVADTVFVLEEAEPEGPDFRKNIDTGEWFIRIINITPELKKAISNGKVNLYEMETEHEGKIKGRWIEYKNMLSFLQSQKGKWYQNKAKQLPKILKQLEKECLKHSEGFFNFQIGGSK